MRHLLRAGFILGLLPIAMGNSGAWAQGDDGAELGVCALTAVVTGKYPEDRYVRAEPESDAPLLAQLEGVYRVGNDRFYPEVEITGSENGWFRISEAKTNIYIVETPIRVLFEGEGWIHGSGLDLSVEGSRLMSAPSWDSPVAFDFGAVNAVDQESGVFSLDRLVACQGYWVKVEGTYLDQPAQGWTNDTCASQVTTCP